MEGFYGRLLRVNLGTGSHCSEELPNKFLARCLGGKGLGTFLLNENVKPGADPLGPDNCLIFATGPVTGTIVPGSNRYGVFAKSPLTGLYGESYSGGAVAAAMRRTGYDAIIIEGKSEKPVYLDISDSHVIFREADKLWGWDCYATEDAVLDTAGDTRAQALVIGPAGENMVRFACIENNYWRSAGRTGMGAVMGSKNLKAIVFHGNAVCKPADETGLRDFTTALAQKGKDNPGVNAYRKYGTPQLVSIMNTVGGFPARYWNLGRLPGWESLTGDYLLENFNVKPKTCAPCFMNCGKLTEVTRGRHAGLKVEGPEYETIYSFGGLCCINDLAEIIYLNDLCDRLGLDTISAGNLAAFAIAASARGVLDMKIDYGDVDGVAALLKDIAYRRGVGSLLAEGVRPAAEKLGVPELAIHVKGMEPAGYDPRVLHGMGLAYATSPRGACHLRATFYKPELAGMIDPRTTEGKAELFIEFEDRLAVYDALIMCRFYRDLVQWEDLVKLVNLTTGLGVDENRLRLIAKNIVNSTRIFNLSHGLVVSDDYLPQRFHREPLENGDILPEENFRFMLSEYYRLRGWDQEGRPGEL